MPSPFPGMDPYLEGSEWMTIHSALAVELARQLMTVLPARYTARLNEWFVISVPEPSDSVALPADLGTPVYADAYVASTGARPTSGTEGSPSPAGAIAAHAIAASPLQLATAMPEPIRHVTVEVRDVASRMVVTLIEILSPVNKRGAGRREYLRKRRRVLLSPAHLIEIDLLRRGRRPPMSDPLPDAPYFVLLSRAQRRPLCDVWPIHLNQPLPVVPVPLLGADPDVNLDLQQAFVAVYDLFRYDRTLDYTRPPSVRLGTEEGVWADRLLEEWRSLRT